MRQCKLVAGLTVAAALLPFVASAQTTTTNWADRITLKGFIQFDAIFPEGNSTNGSISNFRIRRARPTMVIAVDPLTKVQVQVDVGSGKCGTGNATTNVTDTFIERQIPGRGILQAGQSLIPFGREVKDDNAAIRTPLELSYVGERLALAERDLGVHFRSDGKSATNWQIGVYNGQGWRSADSNPNKTVMARVTSKVCSQATLGLSAMTGTYRAGTVNYDREALGVDVAVNVTPAVTLTGELYNARFVGDTTAPVPARFTGGYLLIENHQPSIKSTPFVRYQRCYGGLDYRSVDFGWKYDLDKGQRITAEYDLVEGHQRDWFGTRWQVNF